METTPISGVLGKIDLLPQLQSHIQGKVIASDHPAYEQARKAWNLTVDQHPMAIVKVKNTADIIEVVRFASQQGLGVAVQAGGHGVIRKADNALLIHTNELSEIAVDEAAQTARIGAGLKWGPVLEKTQQHGLAPLLGSSPDVGAVGYTLGGGLGWLARKYGLAVDSVIAFDVVTADGAKIRASAEENSDLFWALRGGGGGFCVVTAMEIRLYPITTVYAGNLLYSASEAREVFQRFREWMTGVPEELTASLVLMNYPPVPALPEMLRGRAVVIVRGCFCGPIEQGQALIQPWRDWKTPLVDDFKVLPFSNVAKISNDPVDPSPSRTTGMWLREFTDAAAETLIRYGSAVEAPLPVMVTEVRHAGGAISRVDKHANAFGERSAAFSLQMIGMTPTADAVSAFNMYTEQVRHDLEPHLTGTVYPNFLEGQEAFDRTQEGFLPESFRRLREIKAKYDPTNMFRFSYNISPAEV